MEARMTGIGTTRRGLLGLGIAAALAPRAAFAQADEPALWRGIAGGGHVVLIRHALAPGVGDPPGFRLGECATQRNLSAEGQAQARAIGEALRRNGVRQARVMSSRWCRSLDTARGLGFGEPETPGAALDSHFARPGEAEPSRAALTALIASLARDAPSTLMVSHQVNISGFTGVHAASGEMVVLALEGGGWRLAGRITPPR
jgi:phosphohistidine phosphatase SixA